MRGAKVRQGAELVGIFMAKDNCFPAILLELPFAKALEMMETGEIRDRKTIMLLQYARIQINHYCALLTARFSVVRSN